MCLEPRALPCGGGGGHLEPSLSVSAHPLIRSLYHFLCTVSSAPHTLLGAGYSVNTPDKRAFSRVGAGDDLTPVIRLRNYSYFSLDKPRGILSNVCYYVQRVFYEMICQGFPVACESRITLATCFPASHAVPSPLLPLPTRLASCLHVH